MTYKKRCTCGMIVSAKSADAVGEAIRDHCAYTGHCAREAKNV